MSGRKSSASPMASAATAAVGAVLGSGALGRFARGLLGGLLR
jgi:hypothetical protein